MDKSGRPENSRKTCSQTFPLKEYPSSHIRVQRLFYIAHHEWFGHEHVDVQAGGFFDAVQRRHEDDDMALARLGMCGQALAYLFAAEGGHHQVEEDQVALRTLQEVQGLLPVAGRLGSITFTFEDIRHHVADHGIVVNDQHLLRSDMRIGRLAPQIPALCHPVLSFQQVACASDRS